MNFNLYPIIIALFGAAAFVICVREWINIRKNRNAEPWLSVEGMIEESTAYDPLNKRLPAITYSYQINGSTYSGAFSFPADTVAIPELSKPFIEKYPKNSRVNVFYNPQEFNQSTLEAAQQKDDWFIFVITGLAVIASISFLIF